MRNGEMHIAVPGERARCADTANETAKGILAECLPGLFQAQVRRPPDRTAFVFGSSLFTYSEFDNAANRCRTAAPL